MVIGRVSNVKDQAVLSISKMSIKVLGKILFFLDFPDIACSFVGRRMSEKMLTKSLTSWMDTRDCNCYDKLFKEVSIEEVQCGD